jgi:hypothetical protein
VNLTFIDDILGIWIDTQDNQWENFKNALNDFGKLKWNIEVLTTTTIFLDLQLSIINGKIHTSTYQKPMNLYTYIPPLSAHPKSCFKGLITGELLRYWHQNTDERDFINITSLFIKRLTQRGHCTQDIIPILQRTAASIDNSIRITANANNKQSEKNRNNTLYIHWKYHPSDITKQRIRHIYNKTLKNHENFEKMIIAVKRPKNLRDILCHTQLQPLTDNNVSNIVTKFCLKKRT